MTRTEAYKWLASTLEVARSDCHIGMFDESMCSKVTQYAQWYMADIMERYAIENEPSMLLNGKKEK